MLAEWKRDDTSKARWKFVSSPMNIKLDSSPFYYFSLHMSKASISWEIREPQNTVGAEPAEHNMVPPGNNTLPIESIASSSADKINSFSCWVHIYLNFSYFCSLSHII